MSSYLYIEEPETRAFFDAAGRSNFTFNEQYAVNYIVANFKAAGVWNKCRAIYPFVGGTASTHRWNLKDPRDLDAAFRLTFNGANQINNSLGYRNNQNGGFANTFLTSNDVGLNSNAIGAYLTSTSNNGAGTLFGYIGFGSDYHLTFNTVAWFFRNNTNTNSGNVLQPYQNKKRMIQMVRSSSTNTNIYEDDRLVFSQSGTALTKPSSIPLYLGAYRNSLGAATDVSGYTIGFFYFAPDGVTNSEALVINNIVRFTQRILNRA